jgi:hypothetical protein
MRQRYQGGTDRRLGNQRQSAGECGGTLIDR